MTLNETNKRVAELKDLHIQSKPELRKFKRNINKVIKSRSTPQLIRGLHGTEEIIEGYDWVIDELFEHIERLQSYLPREEETDGNN